MQQITLAEYVQSNPIALTVEQRDALKELVPSLTITPAHGSENSYILTPGSDVGAVFLPDLAIEIRPKIPIDRVLFLISYALDPKHWKQLGFAFDESKSLVEAIVPGFVTQLKRAFQRGLLQGYRREEDTLMTVRGRIRFEEQIRKRAGTLIPIEVAYDEFTEDIVENQLVFAALERLRHLRLRSEYARTSLRHFEYVLQQVALVPFNARNLPEITFNRLNQHYEPAITLATLILKSTAIELRHGRYDSSAFLVNMNQVFEDFVTIALREAMKLPKREFPAQAEGIDLYLDFARQIRLRPDLCWLQDGQCVFVGDAKYKRVNDAGIKHTDIYQLMAYTVSAQIPYGLLVYAGGKGEPACHHIEHLGKTLEVVVLDVAGGADEILDAVKQIANRIRTQRAANTSLSKAGA